MPRAKTASADASLVARVQATLTELVGIASVSGQEAGVRDELRARLERGGITSTIDAAGNLLARIPGTGAPLLLNAHMDRVPPGRGHTPVVADGVMRSDGGTNLGADDAAGMTIILLAVEELAARTLAHRPLVLLFTVGEEVGMRGAAAFDSAAWGVEEGLVFDNAGRAGAVVTRGSRYIAFDAVLRGRAGHPGKDLAGTASAIAMLRRLALPLGSLDGDTTRISLGTISGGTARNAIPAEVRLAGEVRTLLHGEPLLRLLESIEQDFLDAAAELGGSAECLFEPHGAGYVVDPAEPLLAAWRDAWTARGHSFETITSFIGSDANAFRKRLSALTISTGVEGEHTTEESIALAPLAELVEAAVAMVRTPEN
ncbi:MAG TPA: M20/M25/M40 family metallo-hydrolase [Ktedonobacterales bacterium]|jgi:tripeptide aminopeptidase